MERWGDLDSLVRKIRESVSLICDFDGTLVDSNPIKLRAFDECFRDYPEKFEEILAYCYQNHHTPRWVKFKVVFEKIIKEPYTKELEAKLHQTYETGTTGAVTAADEIPGAEEFLSLNKGVIPIAAVSSTPDIILRKIIQGRGWEAYFSEIKGAPVNKAEWIQSYLRETNVPVEKVLFFGDTEEDLGSSREAGCPFVAVANPQLCDLVEYSIPNYKSLNQRIMKKMESC